MFPFVPHYVTEKGIIFVYFYRKCIVKKESNQSEAKLKFIFKERKCKKNLKKAYRTLKQTELGNKWIKMYKVGRFCYLLIKIQRDFSKAHKHFELTTNYLRTQFKLYSKCYNLTKSVCFHL